MKEFIARYADIIDVVLRGLDPDQFQAMIHILAEAYRADRQIFVAGNGGSAGTANHFVCDFGKNAVQGEGKRRFRVLSVCDNVEKITALGNDIAFDEIFSFQLENLMRPGDVLIVISASGNSPNMVRACELAKRLGAPIIALAGFEGGAVKTFADACLVAPLTSYEQIEDVHLAILHMVVCYFKEHQGLLD
jgi:D-sedoheptulose 7-phosphate isomerase